MITKFERAEGNSSGISGVLQLLKLAASKMDELKPGDSKPGEDKK